MCVSDKSEKNARVIEWLKHSFKYMLESSPKNMEQDEKDYLSKILLSYYQESYNIMTKGKK